MIKEIYHLIDFDGQAVLSLIEGIGKKPPRD